METLQIDLYEFLVESELQQYYNAVKNELKVTNAAQFKYATDDDLKAIGLSRPEIRRLRRYYEKHFPHGYLSKIKRLLQVPTTIVKREDNMVSTYAPTVPANLNADAEKICGSPGKLPNNKHIIPADAITVNKQLGIGEFGIVQQGVWTNGTDRIQVAIKCLCRDRMQSNPMEFLKEAAIMHSIEHDNIVRLYGVVLDTNSLMLVTELAHLRSLLECLKDAGLRSSFLTIPTLCEFALQICNGMRYLEQKRLIHRDLAARNILVFNKDKVKISDFGLSRALGVGKDYYKTNFNVNLKLPIAWCAPECINYLRFTNSSDVWAYGVCLWEMFSYGFQPWAALTGLQILEAIDAPNYQRLEQPDCCPREYYALMLKCWQDDAAKRPSFDEIYEELPDIKPEQLKTVTNCTDAKRDHLIYKQGDIITVLNRYTGTQFWKGVLSNGKTGFFNPSNTVAFLESVPSVSRDTFGRFTDQRLSKRKLRTEMISKPQNDFKHTGHVGIDGMSFGDIAFLGSSQNYNHLPKQIVAPYKPSEDIEQTPLLQPPTPTSPDSFQTASGYFPEGTNSTSMNPTFVPSEANSPNQTSSVNGETFAFPVKHESSSSTSTNPFMQKGIEKKFEASLRSNKYDLDGKDGNNSGVAAAAADAESWRSRNPNVELHEYHEISDDEIAADNLDFGPSLLDEINSLFGSITTANYKARTPDSDTGHFNNMKTDFAEFSGKLAKSTSDKKHRTLGNDNTLKPISSKDEKILNHAIEIANEISTKSMVDLVLDHQPTTQSPKRKFSFRFPHLTYHHNQKSGGSGTSAASIGAAQHGSSSPHNKKKHFTDELQSIPDLQDMIGEKGNEAYNSLIERKAALEDVEISASSISVDSLISHLDEMDDDRTGMNHTTSKTLPRQFTMLSERTFFADDDAKTNENLSIKAKEMKLTEHNRTLPTRSAATQRLRKSIDDTTTTTTTINGVYKTTHNGGTLAYPDSNPIPLPSREGKKQVKVNAKRHVRKYPLIIPASGVQRTLSKVTDFTPVGGVDGSTAQNAGSDRIEVVAAMRPKLQLTGAGAGAGAYSTPQSAYENMKPIYDKPKGCCSSSSSVTERGSQHIYENIEDSFPIETDTASLRFESILESDTNKENALQSPDVADGFYNFSIEKDKFNKNKEVDSLTGILASEDELRNLDIESNLTKVRKMSRDSVNSEVSMPTQLPINAINPTIKSCDEQEMIARYISAGNELAANALFRKVRQTVNLAMSETTMLNDVPASPAPPPPTTASSSSSTSTSASASFTSHKLQTEAEYFAAAAARLAATNAVSCEDLLEFSDRKPKGYERGVDSDEVRIIVKVLGKNTTPLRCLKTLEFINWDVHKAIKMIKLQNILSDDDCNLNLNDTYEALNEHEWDLHETAHKLKSPNA